MYVDLLFRDTTVERTPRPMPALAIRPPSVFTLPRATSSRPQFSLLRVAMPARLRNALSKSLARPLDSAGVYYCPSCATWRRALSTRASTTIAKLDTARCPSRLLISSSPSVPTPIRPFATSSAITAGKTVPPRFRELYDALGAVKNAAIDQVSVSRLQLALRGLESEAPLIRVAGACWKSILLPVIKGNLLISTCIV